MEIDKKMLDRYAFHLVRESKICFRLLTSDHSIEPET